MFGKFREALAARRSFLSHWFMEILVVAIGISIAFALQEWAGDIASKRRAADAETRVRDELMANTIYVLEQIASVSQQRRATLANIYSYHLQFNALNVEEFALSAQLKPLQFGLPLSADARSAMLGRLARLDDINALMRLMAEQNLEGLRLYGIRPDAAELDGMRAVWTTLAKGAREKYGTCWDASAVGKLDVRLVS